MYRDKTTGNWHVSITAPGGRRTRRSTGTSDKKLAKEIETRWKADALRVSKLGELPAWTFDDVMAWYAGQIEGGRSEATERHAIARVSPWLTGKVVAKVLPQHVDACVSALREDELSDHTIRRYLAVISSAFTKAGHDPRFRGLPNPIKGLMPTVDQHDHRLRWEENPVVHQLAQACADAVMTDLVMLAAYSGMRMGEQRTLTWNRVDFKRDLIHLRPEDQKGKRNGVIVLNRTARDALLARKRVSATLHPASPYVFAHGEGESLGKPLSKDWIEWRFEKAVASVGLEDFHYHDLRHCYCTWLTLNGADVNMVKEMARHTDIRTTLKYVHLSADHLREHAAGLDRQGLDKQRAGLCPKSPSLARSRS
jgi:integrase